MPTSKVVDNIHSALVNYVDLLFPWDLDERLLGCIDVFDQFAGNFGLESATPVG